MGLATQEKTKWRLVGIREECRPVRFQFSDENDEGEIENGIEESQEEYTPEQESQIKEYAQDFFSDVKALATQYMERFFQDKMLHCGGKIPKSLLFHDRRISMVLNYDIIKGVERAYKWLDKEKPAKYTGEATEDIRLVNETLNLLARSGVPQQFAGGMMCLYLEFVEGIEIGTEP